MRILEQHPYVSDALRGFLQILQTLREVAMQALGSLGLDRGDTHEVQELEAVAIREQGVPQPNHVEHVELLAHQQHQPPQRIELRVNVLVIQVASH